MRRKDREITGIAEKLEVIAACKVCRIALSDKGRPYIVPLNYGYSFEEGRLTLYFHSAREGRKMDILGENNHACFEADCGGELIEGENSCAYGYAYKSVVGFGTIVILETVAEKIDGLNKLMRHQTGQDRAFEFEPEQLDRVAVYRLSVEEFTGKERRAPRPGSPGPG
jgi:nitroimidazol reductase NimA-like FMN-containing flavoprotein (pyridoxamine 5'-phosphate oxidase superfamily)